MAYDDGFYRHLLDNLHDGVYFTDRDRRITYWNRGAERLTGYAAEEVEGRSCADNLLCHVDEEGTNLCEAGCPLAATMVDGIDRRAEVYLHHKDGHRVPIRVIASPIRDARQEIVGAVEVFHDNSQRQAALAEIERLREMALLDHLTGVANRRYVESHLVSKLGEMDRYQWGVGVLYIDLDHFKAVNDNHGHAAGDRVLCMVAETLKANARSFDLVGRWGGEEFLMVLTHVDPEQLLAIAGRVRLLAENSPVTFGDERITVTLSIGATLARDGERAEELVERADQLMYRSKVEGRNRVTTDL